jgi:hypothetical protein
VWELPSSGEIDACKQDLDEKVQWVGFNVDEDIFATVTNQHCRLWHVENLNVIRSVEFEGFYRSKGYFHPNGLHLLLTTKMGVLIYDLELQLIASHQGMCLLFKSSLINQLA